MISLPRKLTFQLTPLLDLLLIVIFAQYMEVRETAQRSEAEIARQARAAHNELAETREALTALQAARSREFLKGEQRIADLENQNSDLQQQLQDQSQRLQELETQKFELSETLRHTLQEQERIGRIVKELFQVPEDLMQELLKPGAPPEMPRTAAEVAQLRQKFQQFAQKSGRDVIKHLIAHQELRKRSDIWDVYVRENGSIVIRTPVDTREFRAKTADSFAVEMFQMYKSLPQPKSLVIMLLSYDDAKALWRQAAIDGLRQAAERMRADSNGRTRFEYAILGYIPAQIDSSDH